MTNLTETEFDLTETVEWELLVRDLTDSGVSRTKAEKIALEWMKEAVK